MERDYNQFPKDDNGDVLWQLRCEGDALTEPREIDFTLLFPSKKAAHDFAATLREKFRVELQEAEEQQDDGLNWEVIVFVDAVPSYPYITALEEELGNQAAGLNGRASGWSSVFVPSSQPMIRNLWWSYLASYDDLLGSTLINLALKDHAPMSDFPNLLMSGVSYETNPEKPELKLPTPDDLNFLCELSEKRVELVKSRTPAVFVGHFLHDSEIVDYFYVADAAGLEAALRAFHEKECPGRRQFFKTQSDPKWGAYLDFLYPNETTIEHYRTELEELGAF